MFEVDVGLLGSGLYKNGDQEIDLKGQNIMQFADVNADMFTDIIAVDKSRKYVIIHFFDPITSNYTQKVFFKPTDCNVITNVADGRSAQTYRLFITCQDIAKKTILRMYDRNMNGELQEQREKMASKERDSSGRRDLEEKKADEKAEKPAEKAVVAPPAPAKKEEQPKEAEAAKPPPPAASTKKDDKAKAAPAASPDLDMNNFKNKTLEALNKFVGQNHMVFKTEGMKSISFEELPEIIYLTQDSQPFIGDLNGDMIDDVLFNNQDDVASTRQNGKLNVALYNPETNKYDVGNFRELMVDPECGGVQSMIENPELTTPHSAAMLDFDGDCMADLFLTVQDGENPSKKYYEVYLRREQHQKADTLYKPATNGLKSLCLVQYDDISSIQNNQIFDFADIDRDGMIDMLFITDKKAMNFMVNYNMLKSPTQLAEAKRGNKNANEYREFEQSIEQTRQSICAAPNRPVAKLSKIFPSYNVDLSEVEGDQSQFANDDEVEQSKYVFNQLLSSNPQAKEIFQDMSSLNNYLLPRIRIGDIDSDGYPDILVTIRYQNGSSIPQVLLNREMPHTAPPTSGLTDLDFEKIDQETQEQKNQQVKNRFFSLNVTNTDYHAVLYKY